VIQIDNRDVTAIPSNVVADIRASTVFGNKYVALSSPKLLRQNMSRAMT
jgi:phospholipid/cholesterol/gamma-HCH transport system substrate-binding protein